MAIRSPYLFSAAMDVEPSREGLFNEVYDNEHVPLLLAVPGVISVARFKREELTMVIGGERRTIVVDAEPRYNALYELEGPGVLTSEAWAKTVDAGRWAGEVRPYTRNRRHVLYRRRADGRRVTPAARTGARGRTPPPRGRGPRGSRS